MAHPFGDAENSEQLFGEAKFGPVLVTCTLLARYLHLLAVARRCTKGRGSGSPQPVAIRVVTGAPKMAPGAGRIRDF